MEKILFTDLPLQEELARAVRNMCFTEPTPVQAQVIPPALQGKDILATSQTGTGKTLAFMVPLFTKLINNPKEAALVLAPTRELALQIQETVKNMWGPKPPCKSVVLIGGTDIHKQYSALRANPRLIIATPGRIIDHLNRNSVSLKNAGFVVLDEVDRMLDMGFIADINFIFSKLPKERQVLMFSATLPPSILKMAEVYQKSPERVAVGLTHKAHENIEQNCKFVDLRQKFTLLKDTLISAQGSALVFVKAKHIADRIAKKLREDGLDVAALHGDLSQNKRGAVMKNFRDGKTKILIATDLAARGLDIDLVDNVINYDVPYTPEEYIHRIGRTGRAGREGRAVTFVAPEDRKKWAAVQSLLSGQAYRGTLRKSNRVIGKIDTFKDQPEQKQFIKGGRMPMPRREPEKVRPPRQGIKVKTGPAAKQNVKHFDFVRDAAGDPQKRVKEGSVYNPRNKYADLAKKAKEERVNAAGAAQDASAAQTPAFRSKSDASLRGKNKPAFQSRRARSYEKKEAPAQVKKENKLKSPKEVFKNAFHRRNKNGKSSLFSKKGGAPKGRTDQRKVKKNRAKRK